MEEQTCHHCGSVVEAQSERCLGCGMPLSPHTRKAPHRKFILWFVALIVFCVVVMLWLPPDWSAHTRK